MMAHINDSIVIETSEASLETEIPTYLISDYVEIVYLGVVLLFGIPSNIIILRKLLIEQRLSNRDTVKSGFVMLKINLNVTDLFILFYALGKLIWLITYQWVGGDFLCRFYQMFSMFSLYSSSNIVVCIALDRLRNVLYAKKVHIKSEKVSTVTVFAVISWIAAFICSLPQFVIFEANEVYPGFIQCTDIWQLRRHKEMNSGTIDMNTTLDRDLFIFSKWFETAYNIIHLILVFWGPLLVLIITYALIATKLMKYSLKPPGASINRLPLPTTDSTREFIMTENTENEISLQLLSSKKILRSNSLEEKQNDLNISLHSQMHPLKTNRVRRFRISEPDKIFSVRWIIENNIGNSARFAKNLTTNSTSTTTITTSSASSRLPTWRKQLRSRVFRTTMLVILTHFLFWFPYNALGLMKYVSQPLFELLSANANIFKDLQILITLINPFLYGFSANH